MMRKSLWISVLSIVLCVGLAVMGFTRINRAGEQVRIEENVLSGDKSVLDGLSVTHHMYSQIGGPYLYWDTVYQPGMEKPSVETNFAYAEEKREEPGTNQEYLNIRPYGGVNVGSSGYIDLDEIGGKWGEMLAAVAERAENGTESVESVRMKDYFTYLPMCIDVNVGELKHLHLGQTGDESEEEQWVKDLQRAFRVPVPDECKVGVSISKNNDGRVIRYSVGVGNGPELSCSSVVTDEYCYLLITGTTKGGTPVNTEYMRGDWGIYQLPYKTEMAETSFGTKRQQTIFRTEKLKQIASVDPMIRVTEMSYDEIHDRIEIIYQEGIEDERTPYKLMAFDAKTGENVQTMTLTEEGMELLDIYHHDDFTVISLVDTRSSDSFGRYGVGFVLCSRDEGGNYQKEFEGVYPQTVPTDDPIWYNNRYTISMDFDGERLVMGAVVDGYLGDARHPGLFQIIVYEAGEPVFHGQYQNSLVIGEDIYTGCQQWGTMPVEVNWE